MTFAPVAVREGRPLSTGEGGFESRQERQFFALNASGWTMNPYKIQYVEFESQSGYQVLLPDRLTGRISDFESEDTGSNPERAANFAC